MSTPLIIFTGAERGGSGKTTTCRALRDYMETPGMRDFPRPRMLDAQFPRGDLIQFQPDATIVNLTEVSDQMKVFDTMEGVTIVDLPAGLLGFTLRACDEARLLDDVRDGKLRMALLHVLGPSISSLAEISDATALLGTSAKHFIVKNHVNESKYFEWDQDSGYAASLRALADITIEIPNLDSVSTEATQAAKTSFIGFAGGTASRTLRGRVAKWLDKTWSGFDKVGLGRMIEETFR